MVALKVQITERQAELLDELARRLDVPGDTLAANVIGDYLDSESWRVAEIEAGLAEAERGEFADRAEITKVVVKYAGRT